MTDFVLIHGAYQGGWIWKFVAERLRAKGHNVLAPTLDGCGERAAQMRVGITTETHAEEIAKLLYFHDLTKAVLVGTSSGGMVMARAAEQARERVARVVFADALALFNGESILDIVKRPTTAIDTPLARGPSREDAVGRLVRIERNDVDAGGGGAGVEEVLVGRGRAGDARRRHVRVLLLLHHRHVRRGVVHDVRVAATADRKGRDQ